jgi:hypothetical protein
MLEQSRGEYGARYYNRLALGLAGLVCMLVIVTSIALSLQSGEYNATEGLLWTEARADLGTPKEDYDHDGLPNIDENYEYGTNIYNPDTDGDGMDDYWEVQWFSVRDPLTEELVIDPNDPSDAFEDPDSDGYDFNRNGRVDRFDDAINLASLDIPAGEDYRSISTSRLLQNPSLYADEPVRLEGVYIMDNTSLSIEGDRVEREVYILVAEDREDPSTEWVRILVRPYASRPVHLSAVRTSGQGSTVSGDRVDVQGVLRIVGPATWVEIRGGEGFTNIMEYRARFAFSVPNPANPQRSYNLLDPTNPDTDGDGMNDGWEAYYGEGYVDPTTEEFTWKWGLDPTNASDAYEDMDGDATELRWEMVRILWVDEDGDGILEPPGGARPSDTVTVGVNLHEYILNTDPRKADSDTDSYPADAGNTQDMDELFIHGTDPTDVDTDGDGMWDGWEIYYGLLPGNGSDQYEDIDLDGLVNYLEFVHDTDPTVNDTDEDGMWDGWEVEYSLDPLDPRDAHMDPDSDMLDNLDEYDHRTNPRDPDTDRDFLTDYEEVFLGWFVTANGKTTMYHTDPTMPDTDLDDRLDDEDGDGNYDPNEEILDGIDNDLDSSPPWACPRASTRSTTSTTTTRYSSTAPTPPTPTRTARVSTTGTSGTPMYIPMRWASSGPLRSLRTPIRTV